MKNDIHITTHGSLNVIYVYVFVLWGEGVKIFLGI